jgi:hypothetical protein
MKQILNPPQANIAVDVSFYDTKLGLLLGPSSPVPKPSLSTSFEEISLLLFFAPLIGYTLPPKRRFKSDRRSGINPLAKTNRLC